jgi:hypothetical protein
VIYKKRLDNNNILYLLTSVVFYFWFVSCGDYIEQKRHLIFINYLVET